MNHGDVAGYREHKKRGEDACEACNEANNRYHRRLRKERTLGYPARTVPIEQVRDLAEFLMETEGHSITTLAASSGLPRGTLNSMLYSTTRVRTATRHYQALLNSDPPSLEDLPKGRRVDALGTRRRLQGLAWQGWPTSELASRLGVNESALSKLRSGTAKHAEVRTAIAVRELTARLEYQPPPKHVRRRDISAVKNLAAKNGWAPLAAWDDIDDPYEQAKGVA